MSDLLTTVDDQVLAERFEATRRLTEALAAPLSAEDQTVQSMPDVSPTKWHRAHTSWFFETFLLTPSLPGYELFHPDFGFLFNSYYVGVGDRYPRPDRGLISRPGIVEVADYRRHVDAAMCDLLDRGPDRTTAGLVELGIQHEQQHQELLIMDIKHVLSRNPMLPAYAPLALPGPGRRRPDDLDPAPGRHRPRRPRRRRVRLRQRVPPPPHPPRALRAGRPGRHLRRVARLHGRRRLPAARAVAVRRLGHGRGRGLGRPALLVEADGDGWHEFTLAGDVPVDPARPVCHVSYYEADAFARWAGAPPAHRGGVGGRQLRPGRRGRRGRPPAGHRRPPSLPRHRRVGAALRRRLAVDLLVLQPLPGVRRRPRARSASTTASSW